MKNTIFNTILSKRIFMIVSIVGLIALVYFNRSSQKPDDTLVVGMMSGWPPFMSINQQGDFEGFDVDVAQSVAKRLGKKLVINDMGSLAPLFIALEQEKIDMIFSALDITPKRQQELAMVRYTGEDVTSLSLLFWNQVPEMIKTLQDFKNLEDAQVCAEPGSSQEKFLDQFSFITKKPMASVIDMVLDLRFGKSLAALLEPRVAARLIKKTPELKALSVALPPEFQLYGNGIAIKKQNDTLASQVSNVIQMMRQDGTLSKLEVTWELS